MSQSLQKAIDKHRLSTEVAILRETVRSSFEVANIIGRSDAMQKVVAQLPRIAVSNSNVLITGDSGRIRNRRKSPRMAKNSADKVHCRFAHACIT